MHCPPGYCLDYIPRNTVLASLESLPTFRHWARLLTVDMWDNLQVHLLFVSDGRRPQETGGQSLSLQRMLQWHKAWISWSSPLKHIFLLIIIILCTPPQKKPKTNSSSIRTGLSPITKQPNKHWAYWISAGKKERGTWVVEVEHLAATSGFKVYVLL